MRFNTYLSNKINYINNKLLVIGAAESNYISPVVGATGLNFVAPFIGYSSHNQMGDVIGASQNLYMTNIIGYTTNEKEKNIIQQQITSNIKKRVSIDILNKKISNEKQCSQPKLRIKKVRFS